MTHLVGNNLPLTYVWEVPTAGGQLLPYCPGKVAELSQWEVVTYEMGQSVPGDDNKREPEMD